MVTARDCGTPVVLAQGGKLSDRSTGIAPAGRSRCTPGSVTSSACIDTLDGSWTRRPIESASHWASPTGCTIDEG
jgi:hypothetical protein